MSFQIVPREVLLPHGVHQDHILARIRRLGSRHWPQGSKRRRCHTEGKHAGIFLGDSPVDPEEFRRRESGDHQAPGHTVFRHRRPVSVRDGRGCRTSAALREPCCFELRRRTGLDRHPGGLRQPDGKESCRLHRPMADIKRAGEPDLHMGERAAVPHFRPAAPPMERTGDPENQMQGLFPFRKSGNIRARLRFILGEHLLHGGLLIRQNSGTCGIRKSARGMGPVLHPYRNRR